MRPVLRFRLLSITSTVAAIGAFAGTSAIAGTASRTAFIVDTQNARETHDRPDYGVRDHLTEVAQRWAEWMAAHHTLRHNPYLESQVKNWSQIGENVGRGSGENVIQRAFMDSASHRDNILSWSFQHVGIGTARDSEGQLYVDEVFRRPQ